MQLQGDAWCSSGNLWPNGNLMATGGTFNGDKAIRVIANDDPNGDFTTKIGALADTRWYVTNTIISIMFEIISCTEIKCTTGTHLTRSCLTEVQSCWEAGIPTVTKSYHHKWNLNPEDLISLSCNKQLNLL